MKRRTFIGSAMGGALAGGAMSNLSCAQKTPKGKSRVDLTGNPQGEYDILITGGRVIDPANGRDGVMDVAVTGRTIALVGEGIPFDKAKKIVDASGFCVSPGFIDLHTHIFNTYGLGGFNADEHCPKSCVTTVADAGTLGADIYDEFSGEIGRGNVRKLVFLNICAPGMDYPTEQHPEFFLPGRAVEVAQQHPDVIIGFKSAHYAWWERNDRNMPQTPPWANVDATEQAGEKMGLPCMFHFDPEPPHGDWGGTSQTEFLLNKTRPGDMYTHCFRNMCYVIDENGQVSSDYIQGRKRGVKFDVGHGGNSFNWRNAILAVQQGFLPDSISTDLHHGSVVFPAVSQLFVMSKLMACGMSVAEVVRASTVNPALQINRPELGSLKEGNPADIAIFEEVNRNITMVDITLGDFAAKTDATRILEPIMTVYNGRAVFDPYGLGYRYWQDMPADSDYWKPYKTQYPLAPKEAYLKVKL